MSERRRFRPSGISASSRPFCFIATLFLAGCSALGPRAPERIGVDVFDEARFSVGENQLRLAIEDESGSRSLIAYLEVEDQEGGRRRTEARWRLTGVRPGIFEIDFEAGQTGVHKGRIRIYDQNRAGLLFVDNDLRFRVWPRYEFVQDRSYYTNETVARFRLRDRQGDSDSIRIVRVELETDSLSNGHKQFSLRGTEVFGELPIEKTATRELPACRQGLWR